MSSFLIVHYHNGMMKIPYDHLHNLDDLKSEINQRFEINNTNVIHIFFKCRSNEWHPASSIQQCIDAETIKFTIDA